MLLSKLTVDYIGSGRQHQHSSGTAAEFLETKLPIGTARGTTLHMPPKPFVCIAL